MYLCSLIALLPDLNRKITKFFERYARQYSKQEWLDRFRDTSRGTATSSSSTVPAGRPGIGAWSQWSWSEQNKCNYRCRENAAEPDGLEYEYGTTTASSYTTTNYPTALAPAMSSYTTALAASYATSSDTTDATSSYTTALVALYTISSYIINATSSYTGLVEALSNTYITEPDTEWS